MRETTARAAAVDEKRSNSNDGLHRVHSCCEFAEFLRCKILCEDLLVLLACHNSVLASEYLQARPVRQCLVAYCNSMFERAGQR